MNSMKNQKIGERKSDLICNKCDQELVWEGSIMDGKMVCKNLFCIGSLTWSQKPGELTAKDFEQEYLNIPVPAPTPMQQPSQGTSALMARYYNELPKGHRAWCNQLRTPCDCGYMAANPYSEATIEQLEEACYGKITP